MAPRPCLRWPDKRLRQRAAPVSGINDEIEAIWADMIDTMEAMPGVGLAAPQIGVMLRLAVVDASQRRGEVIRMANPEILHAVSSCAPMRKPARICPAFMPRSRAPGP